MRSRAHWAKDSGSEMQLRDVRTLLAADMDRPYLERWASRLGVAETFKELAS